MKKRLAFFILIAAIAGAVFFAQNRQLAAIATPSPSLPMDTSPTPYPPEYQYLYDADAVTDLRTKAILSGDEVMQRDCYSHFQKSTEQALCARLVLDRVVAERDFKVRVLSNAYGWSLANIGTWWEVVPGTTFADTIRWRNDFEKMRRMHCETQVVGAKASSVYARGVALCEINLELKAIRYLNDRYYANPEPLGELYDLQYEPLTEEITEMTKMSGAKRDCYFAWGDEGCR